ncbi:MAG: hypothetical protein QG622_2610 [Actinomycetota bacterium]|nr:hypothetical protein [Actinomycetota bacterium]
MRFSAEIRYDADPRQVFRMIVDHEFQEAKCLASGSLEHDVEVAEHSDGGAVVISNRTMPTDHLPDFARSLVGATVHLRETQRWRPASPDGTRTGSIEVEIHGVPVRFVGSLALAPDGSGTRWPIEGELTASVPLLGGRIERAAEPAVLAGIRVEQRTGTSWLADH